MLCIDVIKAIGVIGISNGSKEIITLSKKFTQRECKQHFIDHESLNECGISLQMKLT